MRWVWGIVMSVLATLGIAAIAAFGSGADLEAFTPWDGLCSMPASAISAAPIQSSGLVTANTHPLDWCTERDSMTDPRCSAGDPSTPWSSTPTRSCAPQPDLVAHTASVDQPPNVLAERPNAPGHGPGLRLHAPHFRPPRA